MIKIAATIILVLGVVSTLAGCNNTDDTQSYQDRQDAKYEFCVSHGGSWSVSSWGSEKCDMSDAEDSGD